MQFNSFVGKSDKITQISEIVTGRIDFNLKVRVMNMWTTPDRSRPTEQGNIHMILVDEKVILLCRFNVKSIHSYKIALNI